MEPIVDAYLVPARKIVIGIPLYGYGWTGVPNTNHGLYQPFADVGPVLMADGTGLCPNPDGTVPGCDPLLTAGIMAYSTLSTLRSHGYTSYFDRQRIAKWLYQPTSQPYGTVVKTIAVGLKP